MKPEIQAIFDGVKARDPNQPEFLQAVEEVIESLEPLFEKYPHYLKVNPITLLVIYDSVIICNCIIL